MKIILGSSSPRRREILGRILNAFEIRVPETDERVLPGETPRAYAERVSLDKARAVQGDPGTGGDSLIIACDTIVSIDGRIIGKPSDAVDALAIIKTLAGRTHSVISGLTLVHRSDRILSATGSETSFITFRDLEEREIREYLERIHYLDKAGAYAVQESGELIIEKIEGSVSNVIGFPLRLFFRMTAEMGLEHAAFEESGSPGDARIIR